jgi:hypothetical protein
MSKMNSLFTLEPTSIQINNSQSFQNPIYRSVECQTNCYNYPVKPYQLVPTIPTEPEDKYLWYSGPQMTQNEQVKTNVKNGLWLCNFQPHAGMDYKLCTRNFFTEPQSLVPPFQRTQQVDAESWMRPQMSKTLCNEMCNNQ